MHLATLPTQSFYPRYGIGTVWLAKKKYFHNPPLKLLSEFIAPSSYGHGIFDPEAQALGVGR
jgi:hypothetical protein